MMHGVWVRENVSEVNPDLAVVGVPGERRLIPRPSGSQVAEAGFDFHSSFPPTSAQPHYVAGDEPCIV